MKRFFTDLKHQPWAKYLGYTLAFFACAALFPGVVVLGYWLVVALLTLMPSVWTLFGIVLVSLAVAIPMVVLHYAALESFDHDFATSPFKTVALHAALFGYEIFAYFMLCVGLSIIPGLTLMAVAMIAGGALAWCVVDAAQTQVEPVAANVVPTAALA